MNLPAISPTELRERLDHGDDLIVLDVRQPFEIEIASLPGSVCVPMHEIPQRLDTLNAEATTVVLCHHGIRSAQVGHFLVDQGFTDVLNLSGGIDAWSQTVDPSVPRY